MAKPIGWYIRNLEHQFERVQTETERMEFENRNVEPYDEIRRCAFSDASVRNDLRRENVVRLGIIARHATELAKYHSFCETELGIDPDFRY